MFDRRVKIFLLIMIVFTFVLVVRALQLQVIERKDWDQLAEESMKRREYLAAPRGQLLDRVGRVIATDQPCTDACVDYRAITPEPDAAWVSNIAVSRLIARLGTAYTKAPKSQRIAMVAQEDLDVRAQIQSMWFNLSQRTGVPLEKINETRQSIISKVEKRRISALNKQYQDALKQNDKHESAPWYERWLNGQMQDAPDLDALGVVVSEQTAAHVIVPAISDDLVNYLNKYQEQFPGLVLKLGTHRFYPYQDVGAHVIGQMAQMSAAEKAKYPAEDELGRYWDDLVGRSGLEALCEPMLRGTRGKVERIDGEGGHITNTKPSVPGQDVHTTIDFELQKDIQKIFEHVSFAYGPQGTPDDTLRMPGAAVVLDVASGEVIALVSYPSYDLNSLDTNYPKLAADYFETPLINRATQVAIEPGSTVKPVVGIGAITQGIIPADETIECNGFYYLNGRKYLSGRCWTQSMYGNVGAHHVIPSLDPHLNGFLNFSDALERSCNVFFETVATKLTLEGLHYWFDQFGLGRPTGIGIAEVSGSIPGDRPEQAAMRLMATRFSGIGQSRVLATPIQMANVAATIARKGIWVRPHLTPEEASSKTRTEDSSPDRVDLKLSPTAVAEAQLGMYNVVNAVAGTGRNHEIEKIGISLAGKTGTAQASPLRIPVIDPLSGKQRVTEFSTPVEDASTGKITMEVRKSAEWERLEPGTHAVPNPMIKWYRGSGANEDKISHAWYIGYAPAKDPKIAFAVVVYYGGSGGGAAGYVAKQTLEELIKHKYLQKQ